MGEGWYCTPVWRGEEGEDGGEVDVAKEEIEREEAKSYQVLAMVTIKTRYILGRKLYLKWSPTSDEFENIIKVLYEFTLLGFHDCCLSFTYGVSAKDASLHNVACGRNKLALWKKLPLVSNKDWLHLTVSKSCGRRLSLKQIKYILMLRR